MYFIKSSDWWNRLSSHIYNSNVRFHSAIVACFFLFWTPFIGHQYIRFIFNLEFWIIFAFHHGPYNRQTLANPSWHFLRLDPPELPHGTSPILSWIWNIYFQQECGSSRSECIECCQLKLGNLKCMCVYFAKNYCRTFLCLEMHAWNEISWLPNGL